MGTTHNPSYGKGWTMLTENIITEVYCLVDDEMKKITKNIPLRQRGPQPQLSDSEVVTMLTLAEMSGIDADKHAHAYFKGHWRTLFPRIGDRSAFVRQASNLWKMMNIIRKKSRTRSQRAAYP